MRLSTTAYAFAATVAAFGLAGGALAQPGPGMMNHMSGHPMMMHRGMMMGNGNWCGGCGYMGPGWSSQRSNLNLSAADVRAYMERYLQYEGNPRVKLGSVKETDANTITADVVTTEGAALVQRYVFDRQTGAFRPG
ncbi:hypothetical protein [Phenylobacterium zucineum]|jgi:hypothetical protein|nr:hypothetical protein [Phenylobacterium zucineum]